MNPTEELTDSKEAGNFSSQEEHEPSCSRIQATDGRTAEPSVFLGNWSLESRDTRTEKHWQALQYASASWLSDTAHSHPENFEVFEDFLSSHSSYVTY